MDASENSTTPIFFGGNESNCASSVGAVSAMSNLDSFLDWDFDALPGAEPWSVLSQPSLPSKRVETSMTNAASMLVADTKRTASSGSNRHSSVDMRKPASEIGIVNAVNLVGSTQTRQRAQKRARVEPTPARVMLTRMATQFNAKPSSEEKRFIAHSNHQNNNDFKTCNSSSSSSNNNSSGSSSRQNVDGFECPCCCNYLELGPGSSLHAHIAECFVDHQMRWYFKEGMRDSRSSTFKLSLLKSSISKLELNTRLGMMESFYRLSKIQAQDENRQREQVVKGATRTGEMANTMHSSLQLSPKTTANDNNVLAMLFAQATVQQTSVVTAHLTSKPESSYSISSSHESTKHLSSRAMKSSRSTTPLIASVTNTGENTFSRFSHHEEMPGETIRTTANVLNTQTKL